MNVRDTANVPDKRFAQYVNNDIDVDASSQHSSIGDDCIASDDEDDFFVGDMKLARHHE